MSIETWKQEFYVEELADNDLDATQNCLTKWIGLRKENLDKHDILINFFGNIFDKENDVFYIDINSCQLCRLYVDCGCKGCPLFKFLGKECDDGTDSIFSSWHSGSNPEPMIAALEKTIEMLKSEAK